MDKENQRQHDSRRGTIPTLTHIYDDLLKGHLGWGRGGHTPGRSHGGGSHTRVIRLRRMTNVSPSSGRRLKKIADSSRKVTGREKIN